MFYTDFSERKRGGMFQKGDKFGNYIIEGFLGKGGMAEVYKARYKTLEKFEKVVVLKLPYPQLCVTEEFVSMFIREARISAMLNHRNIVQVLDFGEVDGRYYITMEYLEGITLKELIEKAVNKGVLIPYKFVTYIIREGVRGLVYLHELKGPDGTNLNLIHRDISPSNIFITSDGGVKLLDFGLVKPAYSSISVYKTVSTTFKGKLGYASPEQIRGKTIDQRADIFSFGVIYYEALTCERLFQGESEFEVLMEVMNKEIVPPSTKVPEIPNSIDSIVMKCLERDINQRYQTARDLLNDISTFFKKEHVDIEEVVEFISFINRAEGKGDESNLAQNITFLDPQSISLKIGELFEDLELPPQDASGSLIEELSLVEQFQEQSRMESFLDDKKELVVYCKICGKPYSSIFHFECPHCSFYNNYKELGAIGLKENNNNIPLLELAIEVGEGEKRGDFELKGGSPFISDRRRVVPLSSQLSYSFVSTLIYPLKVLRNYIKGEKEQKKIEAKLFFEEKELNNLYIAVGKKLEELKVETEELRDSFKRIESLKQKLDSVLLTKERRMDGVTIEGIVLEKEIGGSLWNSLEELHLNNKDKMVRFQEIGRKANKQILKLRTEIYGEYKKIGEWGYLNRVALPQLAPFYKEISEKKKVINELEAEKEKIFDCYMNYNKGVVVRGVGYWLILFFVFVFIIIVIDFVDFIIHWIKSFLIYKAI